MANYRQLHTRTWSDSWFLDLSNEQKLLFIYLFSNQRTSVTGLYELPMKLMALETGLSPSVIQQAMEVFAAADKVRYDMQTGVVWVVNMPKYQLGERINLTLQKRIEADIKAVPDCELKRRFLEQGRWGWNMGHVCPIDGVNSISTQSQSQSQSQSPQGEGVQGEGGALSDRPDPPNMLPAIVPTAAGQPVDVFEVYRNNVGMVTPLIAEALRDAETSDGAEWVCAAIAEAVQNNVRSWKYIAAILSRWRQDGFRSGVSPQELGNRSRRGGGISNDQIQAFMEAGKKGSDP